MDKNYNIQVSKTNFEVSFGACRTLATVDWIFDYQIMGKSLSGKSIMLWVTDIDYVANVKGKLELSQGNPVARQCLIFEGKQLGDLS